MKICIDAGHSPQTVGAVSPHTLTRECMVTWNVMRALKRRLIADGHTVVVTRAEFHDNPSLTQRVRVANDAMCDVFVTIHMNAAPEYNPTPNGCETWIYDKAKTATLRLAEIVQGTLSDFLDAKDRGVRRSSEFTTLKRTKMPAICVEPAFMTNAAESRRMDDINWIDQVAYAIQVGIGRWEEEMEE